MWAQGHIREISPNFIKPKVFYGLKGEGARIDLLSNVFDEEYDKQHKKH